MSDRILVTGATGTVGRELVRLLAARGAADIRAATRSPQRARSLFGDAVEVIELDYAATETYDAAVQWVDRIFLAPAPFDPDAYETLLPLLDWAVQAGVNAIVLLSAMDAEQVEDLALHRLENHIERLGIRFTFLRPNLYMQNFTSAFLRPSLREDGVLAAPAGAARVSFVDGRDVAAVAAAALTDPAHDRHAYTLTGPDSLAPGDITRTLSAAVGRPIRYDSLDDDAYRQRLREAGANERAIDVAVDFFRSIRQGRRQRTTDDVARVLGRPPRTFRAFAEENAPLWR